MPIVYCKRDYVIISKKKKFKNLQTTVHNRGKMLVYQKMQNLIPTGLSNEV